MNFIQDTANEMFESIVKQKDEIILKLLKDKGYEIDLELERKSRFKSMVCEHNEDLEVWYYRDGTPEGLRIVTFEIEKPDFFSGKELSIGFTYKYY